MSPKEKMNGKITERSNGSNDRTIYKDAKSKNEARNSDGGEFLLQPVEVVSTEKGDALSDDSEVEVKVKRENSIPAKSVSRSLSKVSSRSSLEETRNFH